MEGNERAVPLLMVHLNNLEDPRPGKNTRHSFFEIMFISICALICSCESYEEIADFAYAKRDWLSKFISFDEGIPSHDTFRRVFCILNFEVFQKMFLSWTEEIRQELNLTGDQICIDGKRVRGSFCNSKLIKAVHMVNAWSTGASISLGSEPTDKKSNEITAIPNLLENINIKDCLVSLDAMGCQRDIASLIREKGGDYLLALKGNQSGLLEAVEEVFRRNSTANYRKKIKKEMTIEKELKSHGRDVKRVCDVHYFTKKYGFFPDEKWKDIKTIIRIKSERVDLSTGEMSNETRYYISSSEESAKILNNKVKSHWSIENKLHWSLDVTFREDSDKKWFKNSAKNFSLLRQMVLNLLRKEPSKRSLRRKRKLAAIDTSFLEKILFAC